jgi:hypothetical protein
MKAAAVSRSVIAAIAFVASSCAMPPPFPPVADLGGTDWQVVAVNGRQTPAHGDYSLHFGRDGRFGARFGCNSMGGTYRIAGEIYQTPRINVNIVHGTCSDGMSDRVYPDKVQATVDGRRFNGCGGL